MTTTIGSGVGATWGYSAETTVGTFAAPDHFVTFQKEGHSLKKGIVQSQALHGGLYDLSTRRAYTTHTVSGSVDLDLYDAGLGLLIQNMLGAAPTITDSDPTGYSTMVFVPGDGGGMSMSFQFGKPEVDGTIVAFSYNGVKITEWTLGVATGKQASLSVTTDAWNEDLSQDYTAPSYTASNMFQFAEATLTIGGTVTTTDGVTSVSSGTALATCKTVSLKGTDKLATDRYFIGSSGTKAEQIANGFRALTGTLEVEFENLTDLYDAFSDDTPTALELTFTGPEIGSTGQTSSLDVIIPNIFFDTAPVEVDGPAVLTQKASFTGEDDGTNNPIQITLITKDTAV